MKSKIIISLAILIGITSIAAFPIQKSDNDKSVILTCETCTAGDEKIKQSAEIFQNRLNSFGIDNFEVKVSETKPSIQINYLKKSDLNRSMELLTSRGEIGFYEVSDGMKVSSGAGQMSMLKDSPALTGSHISESSGKLHENGKKSDVLISFDDAGAEIWRILTKKNIDRQIAIVIDSEVRFAPTVRSEIELGKCRISGNFSVDEANRLVALINNGELPVSFIIEK